MAKERLYSSLSELPDTTPIIINPQERAFNPQQSFDYETLGKYDAGLYPGMNQEYNRGANQRGWNLLPTAIGRLIGSTLTKFAEGITTIPTAFSANPVSELINETEKHILDEWLPVYSTEEMDSDSLKARLQEPGWWASTATDGAAFFLSAIAGTKGINAITKIPKIARLAKTLGASDEILMNIDKVQRSTVGKLLALDKPGVAFATGYSAFNEAGFEARGVLDSVKNQVSQEKYGGDFDYLSPEQQADVMQIAGEAARQTFWYNVPMLLFSERIFNETVLGNFFGLPESSAFKRIVKEGSKLSIKDLTRVQKAGLMGLPLAANIPTEMFQENYQLAVQNYFTERSKFGGKMDLLENLQGIGDNMIQNFYSIEGKESMFLGGLLGGLGGAFGLGGLSKSEKKAQEYLEILNKGYDNLNKSTSRFFQTDSNPDSPNYGKVVLDAKGRPVMKSQEEIDKDFESLTDEYSKFLYKSTIELINNTNEVGFDILELDKQNSIAELAFKFFEIEDGSKLFEQLIDDYAEKIKKEYGDNYSDKTTKEIADDIKNQVKKLESYYNLANKYYKLDKHPVSLPIQYRSIWKQSFYKETYDKLKKDVTDKIANINPEARIKIDEILKGTIVDKVTNINTQIDKLVNNIGDTEIAAVDKLQLANNIKKTLAYNSLLMEEKSEFDNSLTKAKFYEELKAKQKEQDEVKVTEEAKKKSDEIAIQEALKNATPPATNITGEENVTPEQGSEVTPVGTKGTGTTGTTGVTGTSGTGVDINMPDVAAAEPGQTAKDTLKNNVLDFIKNKPNISTTTIKKEFGNDVVTILDELVNEGLVDKIPSGKGFKYKAKEVQAPAPASAPLTTVEGQQPVISQQPPAGQTSPSVTPTPVTFSDEVVKEAENIITNEYFGNYPNVLNNSNYTSLTKEEAKQVEDLIQQAKNEKWDVLKLKDAIKALGFTRSPGVLSEAYDIYLKNRLSGKISVKIFDGTINFKNALMQELADKKSATPVIQPDKDINTEIEKLRKEKENELKPLIKEIKEIEKEIKEIEKEDESIDLMGEQVGTSNYSVSEGLIYYNNPDGTLIPVLNPEGKPIMDVIIDDIKRREQEELDSNKSPKFFKGEEVYDEYGNKYIVNLTTQKNSEQTTVNEISEGEIVNKGGGQFVYKPSNVGVKAVKTNSLFYVNPKDINAKYDAEIKALEGKTDGTSATSSTNNTQADIERRRQGKDNKIENITYNNGVYEGSFLDDYEFIAEGSESRVYRSKDGTHVIKISEPYNSKDENLFNARITNNLLREIIGNSGLEVIGYYEHNGVKNPIYKQNFVEGKTLSEKEVVDYLKTIKGIVEIDGEFYYKYDGKLYAISDFSDNVIQDKEGNIIPIDLDIYEVSDSKINAKYDAELAALEGKPTVKSKDRLQQLRNRLEELKQQVKEITERYDKQIADLQAKQVSTQPEVVIIENQVPETIPPEVFSQFMRNGFVTEKVLESIAQKELDGLELSKNEKAIRDEKIKEIEAIKQKLIDKKNQAKDNPDVIVNEPEESVDKLELIDLSKYEKMFDANGNVHYVGANGVKVELSKFRLVGRYVTRGDNTLAMRVIEMDKRISYEGDVERHDPNGEIVVLDSSWATTAYMNYDIVKKGGELIIRVADNYENVPIYIDPEHKSDVPFGDYIRNEIGKESYLDSLVDNIPLAIYHVFNGKETLIGYVHAVSWVNGTNVVAKSNEISVQRAALKTFRSQFVSEKGDVYATKSVKSKIENVSNGTIAKGKQSKPVGEVLPDFDIYMRVNDNLVSINKDKKIPIKLIKNKEISNIKNGDVGIIEKDFFFFVTKDKLNQDDINILKENIQNLTKEGLEIIKSRVNIISVNSLQEAKQLYDKKSNKSFLFHNKKDNSILLYTNGMLTNDMNNVLSYIDKLKGTTTNVYNSKNKDNLEYLKSKLISPFRQINANYDGNIKPTIFIHPVISFKMTIDMTKPEIKTETEKSPTTTTKRGSEANKWSSFRQKDTLNSIIPTSEAEELQKKCKS